MKRLLAYLFLVLGLGLVFSVNANSKDIKVGVMLGFTGPIESLTPAMADAAELAFKEASASSELLDGAKIEPIKADSTCVDSSVAVNNAKKLVKQKVVAIMGADCSGLPPGCLWVRAGRRLLMCARMCALLGCFVAVKVH